MAKEPPSPAQQGPHELPAYLGLSWDARRPLDSCDPTLLATTADEENAKAALLTGTLRSDEDALKHSYEQESPFVLMAASTPTAKMTNFNQLQVVGGAALVVADVILDYAVIYCYWADHETVRFALSATVLLASGVANAFIASGALYPAVDGLDLGSLDEVPGEYRDEPKQWLLANGYYSRKVPPWLAAALGFVGAATPVQALHDASQRVASASLNALRLYQALGEAAPLLYIVLTSMLSDGSSHMTAPIKVASATTSILVVVLAVASAQTNALAPRTDRVYEAVVQSTLVLAGALVYTAADVVLRGLAYSVTAIAMGAQLCVLLVGLSYAVLLVGGRLIRPADGRPTLPVEALYAASRLLVHPIGHVVSSRFLWFDALASTTCLLVMGIPAILLQAVAHPHLSPLYFHSLLGLLVAAAVTKIVTFGWCVWPSRCGGGPLGLEDVSAGEGTSDGTPLHQAAATGSQWLVRFYLAAMGKDALAVQNRSAKTPLYAACSEGQTETAHLLLDCGAGVEHADNNDQTPLFIACKRGHEATVCLLLDLNASVERMNKDKGATPLYVACEGGHAATARLLLDRGAAVNQTDNDGATLLFIACEFGNEATARLLLKFGAAVDQATSNGRTPLFMACRGGYDPMVRLLLDHDAVIDQADKDGRTPLFFACRFQNETTARLLLDCGAEANHSQKDGRTPLFFACQAGDDAIVRLLLDRGAAVDQAANNGFTPLLMACYNSHESTALLLLEHGANINAASFLTGNTPLSIANEKQLTRVLAAAPSNMPHDGVVRQRGQRRD